MSTKRRNQATKQEGNKGVPLPRLRWGSQEETNMTMNQRGRVRGKSAYCSAGMIKEAGGVRVCKQFSGPAFQA